MGKSQETWKKKEREKIKQQKKKIKEEKKMERKAADGEGGKDLEGMMAYIDENGNLSSTPPDPSKMKEVKAEEIEIGVPRQKELSPEELIRNGRVTFFNHEKGFGFIKDLQTQESIFVHINNSTYPLQENDKVIFEVEMGQRGPVATKVRSGN